MAAATTKKRPASRGSRADVIAAAAKTKQATDAVLVRAARRDPAVFCQYVLRDEASNKPILLCDMHAEWQDLLTAHPRVVIWSATEHGKAVPLTTEIPTPTGWRTMGDLQPGDEVFASNGKPCRVTWVTPPQLERPVFRVRFDDGDEVLADADHQWIAWSASDLAHGKPSRVVTTAQMAERLVMSGGRRAWKIPLAGPVQYPEKDLPIHPYVLGAWLGDGTSSNSHLTFHKSDRFIFDRCVELMGGRPGKERPHALRPDTLTASICLGLNRRPGRCGDPTSLRWKLNALGVLGRKRKRIPKEYLQASEEQRRELLAGLADTDGGLDPKGRLIEISSSLPGLADDIKELARSLGYKVQFSVDDSKLYGRVVGKRHRVKFTAQDPVFRLPRKVANHRLGVLNGTRGRHRSVVAIEPVASVPVKCIAVDSADHSYLMTRSYTVTHNSSLLSVGRVLWEIGRNPSIRVLVVCAAQGIAKTIVESIRRYIEQSVELAAVFPGLKKGRIWKQSEITVARPGQSRDPTVKAVGYGSRSVLGSRIDLVICDDYLNDQNTATAKQRTKAYNWLKQIIEGRKTPNARWWFIGNVWHVNDAMHMYAKEPGTVARKYPVLDANGKPRWPARWSIERYLQEKGNRGPVAAAQSLDCIAANDNSVYFPITSIWPALLKGTLLKVQPHFPDRLLMEGWATYTGVDLAFSKKDGSDETAIVTISVDPRGEIRILWIDAGKWTGPETIDKVIHHHNCYGSMVYVEDNAAQVYIKQGITERKLSIPVQGHTTTQVNRLHQITGIAAMAVTMANGLFVIPNQNASRMDPVANGIGSLIMHPEVKKLVEEMLEWSPEAHTGDRLQALWIASIAAHKHGSTTFTKKPRGT